MWFLRAPDVFEGLTCQGWGLWLFRMSVLLRPCLPMVATTREASPGRTCHVDRPDR